MTIEPAKLPYLSNKDLIVHIDDEIASLIEEINSAPSGSSNANFVDSLTDIVVDSICGPFGLSRAMFDDRDGGSITTVHNFKKGIIANEADARRYNSWVDANSSEFYRKGNGSTENYDAQLKAERKPLFQSSPTIESAYTGKELPKDGRAQRDHVIAASEIERSAKGNLAQSREDRVRTANKSENLVWAEEGLNKSKSDHDALKWADKTKSRDGVEMDNAQYFDIDKELLKRTYETARTAVDSEQNRAVLKKQVNEFCTEGGKEAGKVAMRQVIGLILKDLATGLIDDIRVLIRGGFKSVEHLVKLFRTRAESLLKTIKEKWADFLSEGAAAGFAGLMSNLTTLLINSFITTVKNVVTIIREATLAVVKSVKLITSPPEGMTGRDIAYEVLKLLSGGIVATATITLQEGIAKTLASLPFFAPFANEIATVLVAILSGTMGLLTVLAFERLKSHIAFKNKKLADVHRGQAIDFLKIKQTLVMLDSANRYVYESTVQMQLELTDTWMIIEDSSKSVDAAIYEYESVVANLSSLPSLKK